MSRTYRRTKGDQSQHRWIADSHRRWWTSDMSPEEIVRDLRRYHSDNGWVMTTPGWFTREYYHVPLRAKTRQYIAHAMRLKDLEDVPPEPKISRPYYW